MEESNYYTPELEEFCVGFEYEVLKNKTWEELSLSDWANCEGTDANYECLNDISHGIDGGKIRVKYLDREDIESLGWESHPVLNIWAEEDNCFVDGYSFAANNTDTYVLLYDQENSTLGIYLQRVYNEMSGNWTSHIMFSGIVKNKTELRKLMKMLGIL
nr:hypothetical protein [uncultured Flavobacterium sp.]